MKTVLGHASWPVIGDLLSVSGAFSFESRFFLSRPYPGNSPAFRASLSESEALSSFHVRHNKVTFQVYLMASDVHLHA